jgi:hypothetical protein
VPYYSRPIHLVGNLYLTSLDSTPNHCREGGFELSISIPDRDHANIIYTRHGHPVIEVPMFAEAVSGLFTPLLGSMCGEVTQAQCGHCGLRSPVSDQPAVIPVTLAPSSSGVR